MAMSNTAMDKAATSASYAASIGTAAGGVLSLNEWALLLGIVFAALTFFINWRYQYKRDVRENRKYQEDSEYHRARMESLVNADQKADQK